MFVCPACSHPNESPNDDPVPCARCGLDIHADSPPDPAALNSALGPPPPAVRAGRLEDRRVNQPGIDQRGVNQPGASDPDTRPKNAARRTDASSVLIAAAFLAMCAIGVWFVVRTRQDTRELREEVARLEHEQADGEKKRSAVEQSLETRLASGARALRLSREREENSAQQAAEAYARQVQALGAKAHAESLVAQALAQRARQAVEDGDTLAALVYLAGARQLRATNEILNLAREMPAPLAVHRRNLSTRARGANVLAFSPDARFLASSGGDGRLIVRSLPTGETTLDASLDLPATVLAWHPDTRQLAALVGGKILVVDAKSGRVLRRHSVGRMALVSMAFSANGDLLAGGTRGGVVALWDWRTGAPAGAVAARDARVLALSPDGEILLTSDGAKRAALWRTENDNAAPLTLLAPGVRCAAFSPTGDILVTGHDDGSLRFFNARTAQPLGTVAAHRAPVVAIAAGPAGERVLSAGLGGLGRLVDIRSERILATLRCRGPARAVGFSPDGRLTALSGELIRLYDVESGVPRADLSAAELIDPPAKAECVSGLALSGIEANPPLFVGRREDHPVPERPADSALASLLRALAACARWRSSAITPEKTGEERGTRARETLRAWILAHPAHAAAKDAARMLDRARKAKTLRARAAKAKAPHEALRMAEALLGTDQEETAPPILARARELLARDGEDLPVRYATRMRERIALLENRLARSRRR